MPVEFFKPRRRDLSKGSFSPFYVCIRNNGKRSVPKLGRFLVRSACFKKLINFFREYCFSHNILKFLVWILFFIGGGALFFLILHHSFVSSNWQKFFKKNSSEYLIPFSSDSHCSLGSGYLCGEKISGKSVTITQGESLFAALVRVIGDADGIIAALREISNFLDLTRIHVGERFDIGYIEDKDSIKLQSLVFQKGLVDRFVIVRDEQDVFRGQRFRSWLRDEVHEVSGTIRTSLYNDSLALGVAADQIVQVFGAFSSVIDFPRDFRIGDTFHFFYEIQKDGWDRIVKTGKLLAVRLTTGGKERLAFRYKDEKGDIFYDELGKSLRKSLLLMPIKGGVLTSGYGMRRNPVHGYTELHPALDFGARVGTPIIAAGDGVVSYAGWNPRGYGKYLKIKHNAGYTTLYAHMSAFARGMVKGKRVNQGQVIGYVGSTGMSTGPHLHYEIHVGSRRKNPAKVVRSMSSWGNLRASEFKIFSKQIKPYLLKIRGSIS